MLDPTPCTCMLTCCCFTTSAGRTTTGARQGMRKVREGPRKFYESSAKVCEGPQNPFRIGARPMATQNPPQSRCKSHLDQQNVWFLDREHLKIDRNRTRTQGITTFPPFDTRRNRIWTNKTYGSLTLITSKSMEIVPAPKE